MERGPWDGWADGNDFAWELTCLGKCGELRPEPATLRELSQCVAGQVPAHLREEVWCRRCWTYLSDVERFYTLNADALHSYIAAFIFGHSKLRGMRAAELREEVAQEAFCALIERWDTVNLPRAYLFQTARNTLTKRLAKDLREERTFDVLASEYAGPVNGTQAVEDRVDLRHALAEVHRSNPAGLEYFLWWKAEGGRTAEQAAAFFGKSKGAVTRGAGRVIDLLAGLMSAALVVAIAVVAGGPLLRLLWELVNQPVVCACLPAVLHVGIRMYRSGVLKKALRLGGRESLRLSLPAQRPRPEQQRLRRSRGNRLPRDGR